MANPGNTTPDARRRARTEALLNLTLLATIAGLTFTIFAGPAEEALNTVEADAAGSTGGGGGTAGRRGKPAGPETPYDDKRDRYRSFGAKDVFKAILTPTPTPPPATPRPTPTPDVNAATARYKIEGIMDAEVTLKDNKAPADSESGGILQIKAGAVLDVDLGPPHGVKKLTLKKVDEQTNPDNPAAVFSLEGTTAERRMGMFDAPAAPAAPPPGAPPPPPPGVPPQ